MPLPIAYVNKRDALKCHAPGLGRLPVREEGWNTLKIRMKLDRSCLDRSHCG